MLVGRSRFKLAPSLLALATFATACGGGSSDPGTPVEPGVTSPAAAATCADGFTPLDGDAGCTPILAPMACPAGKRAAIGQAACVAVGVTSCAPGFAPDATGWGCDAILAKTACASGSGTRERLGQTGCVAVSDCNAAFPPAAATYFVDAAFTPAQIDATHFLTIADAVNAAPSGATIAVESGTYSEKVVLKHRKVSIVGRCAEKVLMKQLDGVLGSGIEIGTNDDALIKNLTMRGYNAAISVLGGQAKVDSVIVEDGLLAGVVAGNIGTDVHLTNVVVRGMRVRVGGDQAFGAFASAGATMEIDDSVFSGNEFVNAGATKADTTLSISRSILRDGKPYGTQGAYGMGVYSAEGAAVTIEESAIVDNSNAGIDVFSTADGKSSAIVRRSVIRRTKRDPAKKSARGIEVTGGDLTIEQSTIGDSVEDEVVITAASSAQISDSTLLGAAPSADPAERGAIGLAIDSSTTKAHSLAIVSQRAGAEVQGTAKLTLDASLVSATRSAPLAYENGHWIGIGIAVESKASLTTTASTIQDAHTVGILVTGRASLTETLIRGTRAGGDGAYGRGLNVQNGGTATVMRSALIDNIEAGAVVQLGGASLAMTASTVKDTNLDAQQHFGIGVLFGGDSTGTIESTTITASKGIGLAVAASGAFVHATTISRNTVAVHAQDGTVLAQGDTGGDNRAFVISNDTRFIENQTRVGNGVIPLPKVLDAAK